MPLNWDFNDKMEGFLTYHIKTPKKRFKHTTDGNEARLVNNKRK